MVPAPRVLLLLPGHGVEDLPAELEDPDAASLLNAAAVAWHPTVLNRCDEVPQWERADDPPPAHAGWLVMCPRSAVGHTHGEWLATARDRGAVWAEGLVDRDAWLAAVTEAPAPAKSDAEPAEADPAGRGVTADTDGASPALEADFFALGSAWLQLTRLARRMHIFEDVDLDRMFGFAKDAAAASVAGDESTTREKLKRAFDVLLDFRERLQPLDPTLIDLVLLEAGEGGGDALVECLDAVTPHTPVCLMGGLDLWRPLLEARPDLRDRLDALGPSIDLVMGRDGDTATDLDPLHVVAEDLARVRREAKELLGKPPKIWGRREFALRAQLPQILRQCGFEGALHIGLDVGEFPDQEEARLDWVGPDHTAIPATSRLPIPSSRASPMWQFPDRLGESMEIDYSAAAILLRFPDQHSEWFEDVRRACTYGPVFGRFLTLTEFFAEDPGGGRQFRPQMREYLSPANVRIAARAAAGIEPPKVHEDGPWRWGEETDRAVVGSLARGLTTLAGRTELPAAETGGPAGALARVIAPGEPTGHLIFNPAPFERMSLVRGGDQGLGTSASLIGIQQSNDQSWGLVRVPPCGFAFVPYGDRPADAPGDSLMWEELDDAVLLRNEFFQLEVSRRTGGVRSVRSYEARSNLLSQRIGYRAKSDRECGSRMVADEVFIDDQRYGPWLANVKSHGRLLAADSDQVLSEFWQSVWVCRHRRWFSIGLTMKPLVRPEGPPWENYFAFRWAWNDVSAPVSFSTDWDVAAASRDRIDGPQWVEIGTSEPITILPNGQISHVRDGRKMDTVFAHHGFDPLCEDDKYRTSVGVAVGHSHPADAALDFRISGRVDVDTPSAAPRFPSGWLASIDAPGVLLLRLDPRQADGDRVVLTALLRETEGRRRTATLTLCRNVAEATVIDWMDRPTGTLRVDGGKIEVPLRGHDIKRVAITLS